MLYSFRNRRSLIQATVPLARKLATLLSCMYDSPAEGDDDWATSLTKVLVDIEAATSRLGGTSLSQQAQNLLDTLENKTLDEYTVDIKNLLDELDMQYYHGSLVYHRFESERPHLTWYKLSPNIDVSGALPESLGYFKTLNGTDFNDFLSTPSNVQSLTAALESALQSADLKAYDKSFLVLFHDRLSLVEAALNNQTHVDGISAIADALSYFVKQKDYMYVDARVWSSLLWHAHTYPTVLVEALGFTRKEDDLGLLAKTEIRHNTSKDLVSYIGHARWPSWKALEVDFVALSEMLEEKDINWSLVQKRLSHIMAQSVEDDNLWNPGMFLQKLSSFIDEHPETRAENSILFIQKIALWKDALLKRDPLSVLDWISLALQAKNDWQLWFKTPLKVNNKVEQAILYEIQDDLTKRPILALKNLEALGVYWLMPLIVQDAANADLHQLRDGLLKESLFWVYENKNASLFFADQVAALNENSVELQTLNSKVRELSNVNLTKPAQEGDDSEDAVMRSEILNAIVLDAGEMNTLLQMAMTKMYADRMCNDSFIRAVHSFKTLALNFEDQYVADFFSKLESWSIRVLDLGKRFNDKEMEILFSLTTCGLIVVNSWKQNHKVKSLPVERILNYLNTYTVANEQAPASQAPKKDAMSEVYALLESETDAVDGDIFPNFKEEAEEIFNQLDTLLTPKIQDNMDLVNRLLHTLKGGARISGLIKLGLWVHKIEDITTTRNSLSNKALLELLQQSFDTARRLFATAETEYQNAKIATNLDGASDSETQIKVPLKNIEKIYDSLLSADASDKKSVLAYGVLKDALDRIREPIKRLSFIASEIYVESEGLLQSGSKTRQRQNAIFDALEMDKFTYFHELTRKLEEAVSDNALYNNLISSNIDRLIEQSKYSNLWLHLAQKDMVAMLNNEMRYYEPRLRSTVRSACKELGKTADISFVGSSLMLNKQILDDLLPALEHLIRNSVAHSIELPDARGTKSETGSIILKTGTSTDWYYFSVSDDGQGINLDKVRTLAIARGLLTEAMPVSDSELCKVLFKPGFSTSSEVNNIAGRGVGLDAVEKTIHDLGGYIDIKLTDINKPEFIVYIPMQNWLLSGVKAQANNKTYIISDAQIDSIACHSAALVERALVDKMLIVGDTARPCMYLGYVHQVFDFKGNANFYPVINLKNGKSVVVDNIEFIEKQQIKDLPNKLYKKLGLSGTTILPDSNVGVVVDITSSAWDALYERDVVKVKTVHASKANLVLVVDDSLTVRKATTKFLTRRGYEVVTAENGLEAIKYLENQTLPAMILMDIEMPVMDGFEALQIIKGMEYVAHIPVVIISSRAVDKHINYARSIGAVDFLGKPFNESSLSDLLSAHIKSSENV